MEIFCQCGDEYSAFLKTDTSLGSSASVGCCRRSVVVPVQSLVKSWMGQKFEAQPARADYKWVQSGECRGVHRPEVEADR